MKSQTIKFITFLANIWTKIWLNKLTIVIYIYWKLMSFLGKNKKLDLVNTNFWFKMFLSKWWLVVEKEIKTKWFWEKEITEMIQNNLEKWDIFVDVWANIWRFSLLSSNIVWDNWKVIAFEPSKYNYDILIKNIEVNWLGNIRVIKKWLWSKSNKEIIHYVPNNPWHSSIIEDERNKFFDKEEINVVTMDEELKNIEKIKLIKIDVEWYEYEVFLWMKDIIQKIKPIIILEFTPIFYNKVYKNTEDFNLKFLEEILDLWYSIYHINEFSLRWELYKTWKLEKVNKSDLENYLINREQSNLLLKFEK